MVKFEFGDRREKEEITAKEKQEYEKEVPPVEESPSNLRSVDQIELAEEGISKRIAAIEVYKVATKGRNLGIIAMSGMLLIVIGATFFGIYGAAGCTVVMVMLLLVWLVPLIRRMKELEAKYYINPKTMHAPLGGSQNGKR